MRQWKITEVVNRENINFLVERMRVFPLYREQGWTDQSDAETFPFFFYCLVFSAIVFAWEKYLNYRQLEQFKRTDHKTPLGVKKSIFQKSLVYGSDKLSFEMIEDSCLFVWGAMLLLAGGLPYAWESTERICAHLHLIDSSSGSLYSEWIRTSVLISLFSAHDMLTGLPFGLYRTFVIEEKHGFNTSTLQLFVKDKLLTLLLVSTIASPVVGGIIWLSRTCGVYFPIYVWGFLLVVGLVMMSVYPTLIAPLFNSYEELPEGKLKTAIFDLSEKCNFPLKQLFTVDGSRRSNHSNAYFYGFGKNKRIVLYDTLIKQCTQAELLAILGHEIGHWALYHTIQGFVISQIYTLCLFLSFSYVQSSAPLFAAFGFRSNNVDSGTVIVGLILFTQTYWGPVDKFLTFLLNVNSRRNEFQADKFSQQLGMGSELSSGLIKISISNLGNLVPDNWYSVYHFSHPPVVERVAALADEQGKSKKQKKK